MLDEPRLVETERQLAAVIHLTIPRAEIQTAMGPGITEIFSTLQAQGITPAGPWFTHHLRMDPAVFDFEIGVPITSDVAPAGRVKPGHLPAAKVARTTYRGGYEGLGPAWGEFGKWLESKGLSPAPDLWEVYAAGPSQDPMRRSGGDGAQSTDSRLSCQYRMLGLSFGSPLDCSDLIKTSKAKQLITEDAAETERPDTIS